MSMYCNAFCIKCHEMYNLETRKMCVGKCIHSICEPCFDQKLSATCPICETTDAFKNKTINWQAHESISAYENLISSSSAYDTSCLSKDYGSGTCSECREPCDKLRFCADCAIQSGLLTKSIKASLGFYFADDDFIETKVLRIKNIAVCSHCALDGTKHKGHKLVLASQIWDFDGLSTMLELKSALAFVVNDSLKKKHVFDPVKGIEFRVKWHSFFNEYFQMIEHWLKCLETMDTTNEDATNAISILKGVFLILKPFLLLNDYIVKHDLGQSIKLMNEAEEFEEKEKWRKISEQLESLPIFYSTRESMSDWKSTIFDLFQLLKSGKLANGIKSVSITSVSKLPPQLEGCVVVAESVILFFSRNWMNLILIYASFWMAIIFFYIFNKFLQQFHNGKNV